MALTIRDLQLYHGQSLYVSTEALFGIKWQYQIPQRQCSCCINGRIKLVSFQPKSCMIFLDLFQNH